MNDNKTHPTGLSENGESKVPLNNGGPRTPEGKKRSSQNAIQHGVFAKRTLLESEDPEEFEDLRSRILGELQPQTPVQECLAEEIVGLFWRLRRAHEAEKQIVDHYALAFNGEAQGIGFAIIADAQEQKVLAALANAEDRLHGRLRRLLNDFHQTKRDYAEMLEV
jgi:hypothetical protein